MKTEGDGELADDFAVNFDGDVAIGAGDVEALSLKVDDILEMQMRPEGDVLKVSHDVEDTEVLENQDVEPPIVDPGFAKDGEGTAIVAPVAEENEGAFVLNIGSALREGAVNPEQRGLPHGDLRGAEEVAQGAEGFLGGPAGLLNDLGVEPDAGELDKGMAVGKGEVDLAGVSGADDLPAGPEIPGDAEFFGEDVHGAGGQQAKGGLGAGETVDDFVDGPIASGGDDAGVALRHGVAGELSGLTFLVGEQEVGLIAGERADLLNEGAGAFPAGGGVEDDGGSMHKGRDESGMKSCLFLSARRGYLASVNKIAKAILITSVSLVAILLLIVVGAHLYVESAAVQSRIETAVSQQMRMPVKAELLRFSLWSGLRVEGLVVGDDGKEPFATIPQVTAKVAWGPLIFSRRLVIRELRVTSPVVAWRQTKEGKWRLPLTEKKKQPKEERQQAEEPKPEVAVKKEGQAKEKKPERQRVEFHIVQASITNGNFVFQDRKGRPLARLEEVNVRIPMLSAEAANGTASVRRVLLREKLEIEEVTTPFEYREGTLALPELKARVAGGMVEGSGTLKPDTKGAPFTSRAAFQDVDLGRLLTELEARGFTHSEGKLRGALELEGNSGDTKSISGKGEARLEGGKMEQYPLLQMLGQTLRISELTRLELNQARLVTEIRKERVYVKDLTLESTNLSLSAVGEVRFDKRMDLDASLAVNEQISRQLPGIIRSNFRAVDGSDRIALPFQVTGTLEDPDTDLVKALMGEQFERQANSLLRAFREFTGGKEKKEDRKKKRKKDK